MGSLGSSSPQTISTLTSGQKQIASQLQGYLGGQIGQTSSAYPGQITAPLNVGLRQGANQLNNFQAGLGQTQSQQAIQGLMSGGSIHSTLGTQDTQNYIQQGIYNPALLNFQQTTLPQITQAFAGQGASFSSRAGTAVQRASSDLNTQLAGQAANVTMQNEQLRSQQDLTAQQANASNVLGASQLNSNLSTSALSNILAQNNQNWQYQQYANLGSNAQYQDFLRQLPQNNAAVTQGLQFIGGQQLSAYNPTQSGLASVLGLFGGMVGSAVLPGIGTGIGSALGGMIGGSTGGASQGDFGSSDF